MSRAEILIVDDEELICWSLQKELEAQGYAVGAAGTCAAAMKAFATAPPDIVLLDVNLPDGQGVELIPKMHAIRRDTVIIIITSVTSLETAVDSIRLGAWDYVTKPFDFPKLYNGIAKAAERVVLRQQNLALAARQTSGAGGVFIAESPALKQVLTLVEKVAQSDGATVLLLGESGVGKDVLARRIHVRSIRAERMFLDLNCAAMPEALLESELFGHERGAFTDAKSQKRGLLELAEGGTVYLDEIGDAPASLQAKLLKFLEQRTFRRVGGSRDISANVRVVAATNHDLARAVSERRFREDLYYRLRVFPIEVPPLRQRREDILPLARAFASAYASSFRRGVTGLDEEVAGHLLAYTWPGNVRELRNVIERAVILAQDGESIGVAHLPPEIVAEGPGAPSGVLEESEARLIREALAACGGNQSRAAAQLGIGRDALRRRMKRHGIGTASE